jgi:hypothetical protein
VSMKVAVVGQNPATLKTKTKSKSISRLNTWLDFLDLGHVSFFNVYEHPGKFSIENVNQDNLRVLVEGYQKIITLGVIADSVLNGLGVDHFALPHPSGLNRGLNDKEYVRQKLEECREYLRS